MNNLISVAPLCEGGYLAHHQIKGAKWGIMHGPPYPLARGKGGKLPAVKKVTAEAKQRRAEQKAAKQASRAEDKKEALRKYIVEHPNKLYKNKDMFTKAELEDIINEINFDQRLKDVKRNNFKKTVDSIKDVAIFTTSVKNIATSAVDTYKAAKSISDILQKKGAFADTSSDKDKSQTGSGAKKNNPSGSQDKSSTSEKGSDFLKSIGMSS